MVELTPTSADNPDDEPTDWVDDYDPAKYRPYVLWFDTLRSGDTAKVYICPHGNDVYAVLHWNGQFRNVTTRASIEEAERKGWECLAALLNPPKPPEPPDPDSGLRYLAMDPPVSLLGKVGCSGLDTTIESVHDVSLISGRAPYNRL